MIQAFFSPEGKYVQTMGRLFDLIVLNVLLIVCSLPVITAGASITAVYDMSLRMLRNEEGAIVRGFFRAFKANFRQATGIWLIALAILGISFGDVAAGKLLAEYGLQMPLTIVAGIQVFVLLVILQYAFALTARFENTIRGSIHNSILLTLAHLPATLWMVVVGTSGVWILWGVAMPDKILYCYITMLLMFWFAGSIYRNCRRIHHIFQQHFGSEEPESEENSSDEERGVI